MPIKVSFYLFMMSFFIFGYIYNKQKLIMRKNISKRDLKRLVEQKVDEAWYNNLDDFYHGVGKCATIGALGAGTLYGCGAVLDKGLENQERYEQYLNQEAMKNMYGTDWHYEKWCKEKGLDPDNNGSRDYYDEWVEFQLQESNIRYMVKRAIVENFVRRELKNKLSENFDDDFNQSLEDTIDDDRIAKRDFDNEFNDSLKNTKYNIYKQKNKANKDFNFENLVRNVESLVKQQLRESEYTDDLHAMHQAELAQNYGYSGTSYYDATIIKFKNGETYELDSRYDDLEEIKKDLSKMGYEDGVDYDVVETLKSHYWCV